MTENRGNILALGRPYLGTATRSWRRRVPAIADVEAVKDLANQLTRPRRVPFSLKAQAVLYVVAAAFALVAFVSLMGMFVNKVAPLD